MAKRPQTPAEDTDFDDGEEAKAVEAKAVEAKAPKANAAATEELTKAEQQKAREVEKQAVIDATNAAKAKASTTAQRTGAPSGAMGLPVGSQMPLHLANKLSVRNERARRDETEETAALAANAIRMAAKGVGRARKPRK